MMSPLFGILPLAHPPVPAARECLLPLRPGSRGHRSGASTVSVVQGCFHFLHHRQSLLRVKLYELPHPPLDSGKPADIADLEQGPVRFPNRDGPQEVPVGNGHAAHDLGHQFFAGPDQKVQRDRVSVIPARPRSNSSRMSLRAGANNLSIGR